LKSSIDNNAVNITALSIERINLFYDYLKNNNLLNDTLVIYLMCPEQIRLKRYLNRLKETNQINLESFSEMVRRFNAEKTQYQVPLKNFPNIFYIDTSITKHSQIIKQIKNFIKGR
jgi:cytidylate kinase